MEKEKFQNLIYGSYVKNKVNLFITYMGYSHDYILFKNGTNEFGIAITDSKSISDLGQNIARPTTSNNQFDY